MFISKNSLLIICLIGLGLFGFLSYWIYKSKKFLHTKISTMQITLDNYDLRLNKLEQNPPQVLNYVNTSTIPPVTAPQIETPNELDELLKDELAELVDATIDSVHPIILVTTVPTSPVAIVESDSPVNTLVAPSSPVATIESDSPVNTLVAPSSPVATIESDSPVNTLVAPSSPEVIIESNKDEDIEEISTDNPDSQFVLKKHEF